MTISNSYNFDVIVIGGGHAGIEAAHAAARMQMKTLLLTHNLETIGQMSCNPSIGGIGKSHLVKEIDALDGVMARAIDLAGIHFRVLNASKGPAVRATRAQADRGLYKQVVRELLAASSNLTIFQQTIDDLIIENNKIGGVITKVGLKFFAPAVILAVGTFLNGKIHVGLESYSAGRAGDPASISLAAALRKLPLRVQRLKTGTPPRIAYHSVDFAKMEKQPHDEPLPVFSFMGSVSQHPSQVNCYITRTNERTHEIIRANLHRSPLFTGVIVGVGPRYCPSIEDKVVRFGERSGHQVFVEPEALRAAEIYPSGISTSLPYDVQIELVHSIAGFENAQITRPGYAIEYDFFDPRDLNFSLESKVINGLYFVGQINGTTGYEEAAAQGLLAGINAALKVQNKEPWWPCRDEAYLGVMIDDLLIRGTNEPYRMFTSRAEYRLLLREDNADLRLTEIGHRLGVVSSERWQIFLAKRNAIEEETTNLQKIIVRPGSKEAENITTLVRQTIEHEYNALELLRRPEIKYLHLLSSGIVNKVLPTEVIEQIEIQLKYAGYIERQQKEIERYKRHELTFLPDDLDYCAVPGLSNEVRQKLLTTRPKTIGQAARIPGVTPAAISILLIYLKRRLQRGQSLK